MLEWWSYRPSDFLMFSSRVYYRQVEKLNADMWPLHLISICLGLYLALGGWRRGRVYWVGSNFVLAALWTFVALGYVGSYLATIHWGAVYVVYAFILLAALLAIRAALPISRTQADFGVQRAIGVILIAIGTIAYPLISSMAGRGLAASEVFGLSPTPTALVTLGFVLASRRTLADAALAVIPAAWCLMDAMTTNTMRQADWWIPLFGVVISAAGFAVSTLKLTKTK